MTTSHRPQGDDMTTVKQALIQIGNDINELRDRLDKAHKASARGSDERGDYAQLIDSLAEVARDFTEQRTAFLEVTSSSPVIAEKIAYMPGKVTQIRSAFEEALRAHQPDNTDETVVLFTHQEPEPAPAPQEPAQHRRTRVEQPRRERRTARGPRSLAEKIRNSNS